MYKRHFVGLAKILSTWSAEYAGEISDDAYIALVSVISEFCKHNDAGLGFNAERFIKAARVSHTKGEKV